MKVGDESMNAIRFCSTAKANLPHLSYIFCKTELLGTEFKTSSFYVTGSFIFIELHRVKE